MLKDKEMIVNVATLRSHLSNFIKQVKAGTSIIVTSHDRRVAKIISEDTKELIIIPSKKSPKTLKRLKSINIRNKTNSLKALLNDRNR